MKTCWQTHSCWKNRPWIQTLKLLTRITLKSCLQIKHLKCPPEFGQLPRQERQNKGWGGCQVRAGFVWPSVRNIDRMFQAECCPPPGTFWICGGGGRFFVVGCRGVLAATGLHKRVSACVLSDGLVSFFLCFKMRESPLTVIPGLLCPPCRKPCLFFECVWAKTTPMFQIVA